MIVSFDMKVSWYLNVDTIMKKDIERGSMSSIDILAIDNDLVFI